MWFKSTPRNQRNHAPHISRSEDGLERIDGRERETMLPRSSAPVSSSPSTLEPRTTSFLTPPRRRFLLLFLSLALVTGVLVRGIHTGEFSENVDETVHAATGLYVAAFLHDLPLRHPV